MKERFTTIDLFAVLTELRERLMGMRVANVYDIDQKTYLIKLAKPEEKVMLLFESGCRMHTTEFEWPKHMQPSGFSMKLRKHLRTRRLIAITQLGVDRVVDLQFGSNEAAYHLIIELYDRGNVILTGYDYTILALLRTRTDADSDVRFAVREIFSTDTVKKEQPPPSLEGVRGILSSAKVGDQLKHALNPHYVYGSALLSHCLVGAGLSENVKIGTGINPVDDLPKVLSALEEADMLFRRIKEEPCKGYLIQKRDVQPQVDAAAKNGEGAEIFTNVEFHPMLFRQHDKSPHKELESFNKAVDEFFSSKSSQKQDVKALHIQKTAVKKLDNIRKDHERRIDVLQKSQEEDIYKAQLVELNADLVERASLVIRSAIANAMDWGDIELLVKDAQSRGDPIASAIHGLKLKSNEITLLLRDPSDDWEEDSDEEMEGGGERVKKKVKKGTKVDIDLGLSAHANARRFYDRKRQAATKEKKTIGASEKALKSAEKKTKQTLKEASAVAKIKKARKVHWFEKFYWFVSAENYLVIGGRDQQQNELVVKKYLNEGDLYVHADLHGATSVVVKNPTGDPVPPKTLNEAGQMALCYSSAWEARIITSAWWVYHHQVSKTAPTGEYLTTGSFMIRGKKNFLPPCQLVLGFGFLFRVEESCIPNHIHERKVKEDDQLSMFSEATVESLDMEEDIEIPEEEDEEEQEGVGGAEGSGQEGAGSQSEGEEEFPDTSITVAHVAGGTYELQRGISVSSSQLGETEDQEGVGEEKEAAEEKRHQHMSAKQRRELRKQKQGGHSFEDKPKGSSSPHSASKGTTKKQQKQAQQPPAQPPQTKRGQKFKQKKAREKYGDQDEEERSLMMDILSSAGARKEEKPKKGAGKGKKKSFDTIQSSNPKQKYRQKGGKNKGASSLVEQTHKQRAPLLVSVSESEVDKSAATSVEGVLVAGEDQLEEVVDQQEETVKEEEERTDLKMEAKEHKENDVERTSSKTEEQTTEDDGAQVESPEPQTIVQESLEDRLSGGEPLVTSQKEEEEQVTVEIGAIETDFKDSVRNTPLATSSSHLDNETTVLLTGHEGQQPVQEEGDANVVGDSKEVESDDEEKKALLAEENIIQLEEAEKEQLSILDTLTGCPIPEDILLYAIPVCAPYSAILNYKYKAKLVPGTNRRGKAAKAALHRFTQSREASQREKDLLKSVKDNDLSRYFPGKVKLSLPQTYRQHSDR